MDQLFGLQHRSRTDPMIKPTRCDIFFVNVILKVIAILPYFASLSKKTNRISILILIFVTYLKWIKRHE